MKLKKLKDQVIVITGASSGIGLVTARMAAKQGAKLVLNARNQEALDQIANEINATGTEALAVASDVGNFDDVKRVADEAIRQFGGFDTWVNNAGVSIYGLLLDQALEDQKRLFLTNYWGVVHGSMIAIGHLRFKGGALINVGSALSDRSIPLQGSYCASKHAVKGYTDALRMELEEEGVPVSVTLIKPSAIDTPYRKHARNLLPVEPLNPPPVYAPETVAEAILHCAQNPERDVYVGGGGKALSESAHHAPRLTDKIMQATMFDLQRSDKPEPVNRDDSLYVHGKDGQERGGYPGHVAESSLYTRASLHPLLATVAITGVGLGLVALKRKLANGQKGSSIELPLRPAGEDACAPSSCDHFGAEELLKSREEDSAPSSCDHLGAEKLLKSREEDSECSPHLT